MLSVAGMRFSVSEEATQLPLSIFYGLTDL